MKNKIKKLVNSLTKQKNKLIIIAVAILFFFIGYLYNQNQNLTLSLKEMRNATKPTIIPTATPSPTPSPTSTQTPTTQPVQKNSQLFRNAYIANCGYSDLLCTCLYDTMKQNLTDKEILNSSINNDAEYKNAKIVCLNRMNALIPK